MLKKTLLTLILAWLSLVSSQNGPIIKIPLSSAINSKYHEMGPVLSSDGLTFFFCREGDPQNTGFAIQKDDQDIWISKFANGRWALAEKPIAPFNTNGYNFPIGVSVDGQTLYIANVYLASGEIKPGVSKSRYIQGRWGAPEELKIEDFYNESSLAGYSIGADENTIVMSVKRKDTLGAKDLYVSFRLENDSWSKPVNLGKQLNSDGEEMTPFLATDMKTLYFASNRSSGLGGLDMYMSKRLDDSWQKWSTPQNLGPQINSKQNDFSYIVHPSNHFLIYSSDTANQGKDFFMVKLPEEFRPQPSVLLEGIVKDSENRPIGAKVIYEQLATGKILGIIESNPGDGKFKIRLPLGESYGIRAEKPMYLPVSLNLDYRKNSENLEPVVIIMHPIKKGSIIRLNNIFFDLDSHQLRTDSHAELNRIFALLSKQQNLTITIAGHTDNIGDSKYNQNLSQNRALAVKDFLVKKGIATARVQARGFGDSKPVVDNDSDKNRQKNRRVEIIID